MIYPQSAIDGIQLFGQWIAAHPEQLYAAILWGFHLGALMLAATLALHKLDNWRRARKQAKEEPR